MSLRPNKRTKVCRSKNKVAVDAEEGQRRREDDAVEIQKNRREESLLKKRPEGLQEESSAIHVSEIVKKLVAGVRSEDSGLQLEATTQFRKLLSIEGNPPIDEVIQSGVVSRLSEILARGDYPQLQFEAAWSLRNIASGTPENTKVIIEHYAVPVFVRLLGSPSDNVREQSQVPPGFRFHPTEEELLHYYLRKKVASEKIDFDVIRDVDLNKLEPWDIQEKCKIGTTPQNDWYFFSHKDKKYPIGKRANRATAAGFWKATGRDKPIYNSFGRIGMRKTLVFYKGRAPHGQRSDWIMYEYRLEDNSAHDISGNNIAGGAGGDTVTEEGWAVCRVFIKRQLPNLASNTNTNIDDGQITRSDGLKDWVAFDRLVASQLNGQEDTTSSKHLSSYYGDDHTTGDFYSSINDDVQLSGLHYMGRSCNQEIDDGQITRSDGIDWVALDRLVASQLNGQENTTPSKHLSSYYGNDHATGDFYSSLNDDVQLSGLHSMGRSCNQEIDDGQITRSDGIDWVTLDQLVASQLNGQEDTTSSKHLSSYYGDDHATGDFSFSINHDVQLSGLRSNGPNNIVQHSQLYGSEMDLWSFTPSSSSNPLCHFSV